MAGAARPGRLVAALRSAFPPLAVAAARTRARPGRGVVVALGVAAAVAVLGGVLGGGLVAGERSLQEALERVPAGDRVVTVVYGDRLAPEEAERADRAATAALASVSPVEPARVMLLREKLVDGRDVQVTGLADPGRFVELLDGHLPGACTEARCEVLQLGPADSPTVADPSLPLVVVGRARMTSALPLGGEFTPTGDGEGDPPVVLVAGDLPGLDALPALASTYRTRGWIAPLDAGEVRSWRIDGLLQAEARAERSLLAVDAAFSLEAPDGVLLDVRRDARVAERRILVVGGVGAALLLGFALLAASTVRRDVHAEWRRLDLRGGRRWHLWLFAAAELGSIALAGLVLGAGAALGAVALAAGLTGLDAWEIASRSLLAPGGLLLLAGAWAVASAVLVAAQRPSLPGSRGRVTTLDVVAVAALGALILAAQRGSARAGGLEEDVDPLLPLVPLLASVVVGIAAYRLTGPLARLGERATSGASSLRLAFVAIARRPEPAAATVAFLAVAVGLAVFAESYRGTLERGQRDQAGFAVPMDATVTMGRTLVTPLDAAPLAAYAGVAPDATALPVLRRNATVPSVGASPLPVEVLGVPAAGLTGLRWRDDYASRPPADLAARLAPGPAPELAVVPVPEGAAGLRLPVRLDGGAVVLQLLGQSPTGRAVRVDLGAVRKGAETVEVDVPPALAGGSLVGLDVAQTAEASAREAHADAEGGTGIGAASGTIVLGPLEALDAAGVASVVTRWDGFTGTDGLRPSGEPEAAGQPFGYVLSSGGHGLVRLPQPTDGAAIPVAAHPAVAAAAGPDGTIALGFGGYRVNGRIVASLQRFPTGGGRPFVLADLAYLQTAIEGAAPGQGRPLEVWVGAPDGAAVDRALARPPFDVLALRTHAAVERALVDDPLARGILIVLACTALLSLALAAGGLVVGMLGDLRDGRGELYDLEALGVRPAALRRRVVARAALLGAAALPLGLALGAVLGAFVVDLVRVSANAATPQPPLVTALDPARLGVGLALVLLLGAAVVWAVARAAFREPVPVRPAGAES